MMDAGGVDKAGIIANVVADGVRGEQMWGSDWPVQTMKESLDEIDALGFDADLRAKLIGGNAARVLGL